MVWSGQIRQPALASVTKLLLANLQQNNHLCCVRAICEHGKTRNMRAEAAQETSDDFNKSPHAKPREGVKPLKSGPFQTLQELPAITLAQMRDMT
jgi:hypothetical protein